MRQPSSASNRRTVFHMKSDLAIAALIRSRMAELGLSRGEFVKRLGYKNIAKGIRRIDVLCDGDLEGTKHFLDVLPQALETSAETVKLALDQTVREIELAEKQEPKRVTESGGRIFVRMPSSSQSGPCRARFSWPRSSASRNSTQGSLAGGFHPCTSNPPCAVACRPWDIAQWEREAVVDRLRSRSAELFIPSDADDTAD